jgi:hypothetical protein
MLAQPLDGSGAVPEGEKQKVVQGGVSLRYGLEHFVGQHTSKNGVHRRELLLTCTECTLITIVLEPTRRGLHAGGHAKTKLIIEDK